ncbi:MAG: hypothetical protein E6Q97_05700 [Desulfurellales bacterium]|nr:MAG: hypothetical protein E6Q97_05700 [Desulfurellales bacterium]
MTTNFHTDLSAGTATTASVNTADGQLDDAITKFRDGVNSFVQVNVGTDTTLTISAGAITITRSRHIVDTEAAVATDDLTDINGGAEGDLLLLSIVNAARQVVVKHNTAKIYLASQTDFTFTAVQEQLLLVHDGTRWCEVQTRTSIVTTPYIRVEDQKAKGTNGGASSATTWHTRTLNTEVQDTGGYASVAANQVTLAAGTYDIRASAPAVACSQHHLVLWNDSDGTLALNGDSAWSASTDSVQSRATVQGRITITSSKAFSLRHYITAALGTNGLGVASNLNDPGAAALTEVYAIFEAWKVG